MLRRTRLGEIAPEGPIPDAATKGETLLPLAEKFEPGRVKVSPKFHAILAHVFGETWTNPAIAEMTVTSDKMVLARHEGDCGFNEFVGGESNLLQNLRGVAECVELSAEETVAFFTLCRQRIRGLAL